MKLIDLIKDSLGIKPEQLDEEIDLEIIRQAQKELADIEDAIIHEKVRQLETVGVETNKRIAEAREKQLNRLKLRNKLKHQKGISPSRLHALKKRGKI